MNRFQIRFPGTSFCQVIYMGAGDAFDPSPIVKSLADRRRQIQFLDHLYATQPLPIHTFCELAGRDIFESMQHLCSTRGVGVNCFKGTRADLREGLELTEAADVFVLSLTALFTLAALQQLPVLSAVGKRFVVSKATFDEISELIEHEQTGPEPKGTLLQTECGGLGIIESSPEQRTRYREYLLTIRDAVRTACEVQPCPEAAKLEPTRREQMSEVIGYHNLEAMLLARAPGAVLWADDHPLAMIARADFGVRTVWTQAVLYRLAQSGAIPQAAYDQATAKMLAWYYSAILWTPQTLLAAAEVANWNTASWPVPQAMEVLGNQEINPVERLRAAADVIKTAWRMDLPPLTKQGFLFAVLNGIRSLNYVARLRRAVPTLFGIDVLGADEVSELMAIWMRAGPGIVTR